MFYNFVINISLKILSKISKIIKYIFILNKYFTTNINKDFNEILIRLVDFLKKNNIKKININYLNGKLLFYDKFKIKYLRDISISNLRNIEFNEIVDELELELIYKNFKNGNDFIDVGSSFGTYSLFVSKFFPKSNIFSFEPNKEYFEIQKKNIKINNFKNINLFQKACFNANSLLSFKNSGGGSHLVIKKDKHPKVNTVVLDKFIKKKNNIGYVKIDVEGAEFRVIEGLKKIISTSRPLVQVELSYSFLKRFQNSITDVFNFFKKHKYCFIRKKISKKFVLYEKSKNIYLNSIYKNTKSSSDFIFIPKEKMSKIKLSKKIKFNKLFYS